MVSFVGNFQWIPHWFILTLTGHLLKRDMARHRMRTRRQRKSSVTFSPPYDHFWAAMGLPDADARALKAAANLVQPLTVHGFAFAEQLVAHVEVDLEHDHLPDGFGLP